ncbi:hypothetical protein JOC36_000731 [Weissella uvarum]|uniref:DUF4231 domain-containing protein n=1 Tax=Weissella uvarum TaxID=1479233 RepID=UPI0019611DB8|nr:DUF4231 domain-containing protein [Weissella uvarum]MBM7617182.1 hypothetical protein [Weissella uvarum]MCM0595478.1 DUF4231 domain-containing protein [Weissella uvarum]
MDKTIESKEQILQAIDVTDEKLAKRLKLYKTLSSISNITRIVLSASIPILVSMASHNIKLLVFVSIAGALTGIIQGVDSYYDLSTKIAQIQQTILYVNKEKLLLMSGNEPYNSASEKDNVQRFIGNIIDELDDEMSDFND